MKILSLPTALRSRFLSEEQPAVDLLKKSKLAPHHVQVAERLKAERLAARYTQVEFASEIGISRAALANYEYGLSKLSFSVGLLVCERLGLSVRWLAEGKDPKRPYVSPQDLGINSKQLAVVTQQRVDFIAGYSAVLRERLERWLDANPVGISNPHLVRRQHQHFARISSLEELQQHLVELIGMLKVAPKPEKQGFVPAIGAYLDELDHRLQLPPPPLLLQDSERPAPARTETTDPQAA